jgi:hypothetical protein
MIFNRRFKRGFCSLSKLIISFFYSSFIQLVVEVDGHFDEIEHIADASAIAHNFVLKIVLEISSKHCHKCDIVSLDKISILLKSCCVLCCRDSLSQMLNYSFCDLFLVKCFEDSSKLSLEVVEVREHCTGIFVIIFQIFA